MLLAMRAVRSFQRAATWLALLALAATATGCSRGPQVPETFPTSGKLTRKGQPLGNAFVTFENEGDSTISAVGQSAGDGTFTLKTAVVGLGRHLEGAAAGSYRVSIRVEPGASADPLSQPAAEYFAPEQRYTVTASGPNVFEIDVASK